MGFMTWDDRLEAEEIPHYLTERDPVPPGPLSLVRPSIVFRDSGDSAKGRYLW
jgi:hypothetical protein